MGLPRFGRPNPKAEERGGGGNGGDDDRKGIPISPNLYVANCGPAVGLPLDAIASVFRRFGQVKGVYAADDSGGRVIVCYGEESSAGAALTAFHGRPCPDLAGRTLHIRYSVLQPTTTSTSQSQSLPVCLTASETNIPGLHLLPDFITPMEEQELLAAVDARPWISLAKRRVQHYGYPFCYQMRNVNTKQHLGELPSFVAPVLERISSFPNLDDAAKLSLDQLTVNEYPPGVGLSPHIDTHSAFEGLIFSLSLAGPCIMEFRRYAQGAWFPKAGSSADMDVANPDNCSNVSRRAIYLPPRSMLLLSGEARYAWHHYIPHHKIDIVNDNVIKRGSRRVSFTLRKVRRGPCQCEFPLYCDSQR
uniref:RNA-binding (RRM/RBD/RNP motifs) family protein n=1 Tax=Hypseocharis bilobata TaxID=253189 RepID=A0A0G4AM65_9ROSI|nr:RNA-binding (RRM/RBD/RNP motifs) family protein [Hypseocharis bilobata]